MHLTTQVLQRNAEQFAQAKQLLVINPPANDDLDFLVPAKVLTFDYRVYLSHQNQLREKVEFSLSHQAIQAYDTAVIFLPKSKGELDLTLAYIAPMLKEAADIYLVGEKKGGIASASKRLDDYGSSASKIDSAKHCQLWHVTLDRVVPAFQLSQWLQTTSLNSQNQSMRLVSMPGVFSFAELDEGSALLLAALIEQKLVNKFSGRVLDFGCGCGVLGVFAKLLNPAIELEMVDINLLALICAEKTAQANGVQVKVYPSDGWGQVTGRVNAVITNPPFHSGIATEYQTTEGFIHQAKDKLSKYAPFILVANSFLKYAAIIESSFGKVDVISETRKFRVYKAIR